MSAAAGDLPGDLDLALEAARAAGRVVLSAFRTDHEVRHKAPDQPVTAADLEADALLRERLLAARPDYGWLSEETVDRPDRLERPRVWIVDPIDGTRSFIAGYAEFGISIGLAEDGHAVLGVIHNPARGEVFWATRGAGAFRVWDWDGGRAAAETLRVARVEPGARARLLASRSELGRGELDAFREEWELHPLGSTAYKMAGVAAGTGHAFLSRGPKSEWDLAAGAVIVEEAGGTVTDLRGQGLRFNRPDTYVHGLLASAPEVHGPLLARSRELPAPRLRGGRVDANDQL